MPESNITGSKKKSARKGVAAQAAILFLLLFFAGSAAILAEWLYYTAGQQEYDRLTAMYVQTTPDPTVPSDPKLSSFTDAAHLPHALPLPSGTLWEEPAAAIPENGILISPSRITNIDFTALQIINPDCVAWIEIPGTRISYPVMYRANDGAYYLTHTFEQTETKAGAIHIDGASDSIDSRNLLIYGHTLLDGSMLTDLHRYKNQRFYQEHPYIYLHLPDGSIRRYQIAACVLTQGEQERFYLWDFKDNQSAQAYYDQFIEQSLYPTGTCAVAASGKQTLVLSTCTRGLYRRLILAVEQ